MIRRFLFLAACLAFVAVPASAQSVWLDRERGRHDGGPRGLGGRRRGAGARGKDRQKRRSYAHLANVRHRLTRYPVAA